MSRFAPPSPDVIRAFGERGEPLSLPGGTGRAWRVGETVLKPLDMSVEALEWQSEVLSVVPSDEVRLAVPKRAAHGGVVVDGWTGWSYCAGSHQRGRWAEVIAAGDILHRALALVPQPAFLAGREDRWAIGDRIAWGELPADSLGELPHVAQLCDRLEPVDAESQLIHGDLTGNVLFHDWLPPAVIDLSPYWRPPAFASAVVVADALAWEGADSSILRAVEGIDAFGQYLARALIYRIASEAPFHAHQRIHDAYREAVELVGRLTP